MLRILQLASLKEEGVITDDKGIMAYCSKCGKEVAENSSFCSNCGEKRDSVQNSIQKPTISQAITDEDFSSFIGKNANSYITKFKKFNMGDSDNFAATWHWPAFFVPFLWLLYRKLYLWALLVFCFPVFLSVILPKIPTIGVIIVVGCIMSVIGITANYIFYKHAKKRILALKSLYKSSESQGVVEIARAGGVNKKVVVWVVLVTLVVPFIAAITIPQFNAYKKRGYCVGANSDLKMAQITAMAGFSDNPQLIITDIRQLTQLGFNKTGDNIIQIKNFSINGGWISATHPQCDNIYFINPNGEISERLKKADDNVSTAPIDSSLGKTDDADGQHKLTIEDYNEAIRLNPDDAKAYHNRGAAYGRIDQYQRAIEDYNEAIRLKPDYVLAYNDRGVAYVGIDQYQRAIENFNEAIRLNPDDALGYKNRGIAYLLNGDNNMGCRDAQKACELGNCKGLEWANDKGHCQ